VTLASVTVAPGGATGRHRHPGIEIGYVVDGEITVAQDGLPELNLGPGMAFTTDRVHDATNHGAAPPRLVVAYVVERGKPLAEAVP
jgi:quercetin dioxygenase-like cupin family protein